jgi:hypothetical protein
VLYMPHVLRFLHIHSKKILSQIKLRVQILLFKNLNQVVPCIFQGLCLTCNYNDVVTWMVNNAGSCSPIFYQPLLEFSRLCNRWLHLTAGFTWSPFTMSRSSLSNNNISLKFSKAKLFAIKLSYQILLLCSNAHSHILNCTSEAYSMMKDTTK